MPAARTPNRTPFWRDGLARRSDACWRVLARSCAFLRVLAGREKISLNS
jgi:hypothetical protein